MADRRRAGIVNQRTLALEPELSPPEPPEASPEKPSSPPPADDPPEKPPRTYAPVISSSDGLWERKLRWSRTREQLEAARGREDPPAAPE